MSAKRPIVLDDDGACHAARIARSIASASRPRPARQAPAHRDVVETERTSSLNNQAMAAGSTLVPRPFGPKIGIHFRFRRR
jgi:hypothetical protein